MKISRLPKAKVSTQPPPRHAPRPHPTLNLVLAIEQTRSITRGAEREHLALAAASKRISDLETRLGVQLFERRARGVEPTEACRALVRHIRSLHASLHALESEVVEFARGIKGHLRTPPTPARSPRRCRPIWRRSRKPIRRSASASRNQTSAEGPGRRGRRPRRCRRVHHPAAGTTGCRPGPTAPAGWPCWSRPSMNSWGGPRSASTTCWSTTSSAARRRRGARAHDARGHGPRPHAQGAAAGARLRRDRAAGRGRHGRRRAARRAGPPLRPGLRRASPGPGRSLGPARLRAGRGAPGAFTHRGPALRRCAVPGRQGATGPAGRPEGRRQARRQD
ncbi:bacterial regulatory helix-turn-helix protein, lysR family domain-containing protein [Ditylenchus destructor]|nr:bacterial regulatory helix-turn-helix protein, lysR family domain-containing protein [Ditylenchus destructor]